MVLKYLVDTWDNQNKTLENFLPKLELMNKRWEIKVPYILSFLMKLMQSVNKEVFMQIRGHKLVIRSSISYLLILMVFKP